MESVSWVNPHTDAFLVLLQRHGANQLALRIAARLSAAMAMVAPWEGAANAMSASATALVSKALRARHVDGALGVGYMLGSDPVKAHATLALCLGAAGPQWARATALAAVGIGAATLEPGVGDLIGSYQLFHRRAVLLDNLSKRVEFDGVVLRRFFTTNAAGAEDA